jgi:alcohol dehydrogenase class IV
VPTTPTSAMNRAGSGLRNDALDHRMEFFDPKTRPVALFWDEEALLTAPLALARSTGTTTFTGCLHAAASRSANPLVDGDQRQALRLARRALPRLVADPGDARPRVELCAAAFLQNRAADDGGTLIARDGAASAAYALATALHVRYEHIGQGEATSAVTPAVIRERAAARGDGLRRMAEALGVPSDRPDSGSAAPAVAEALGGFYRDIGMPARVRELGISEADLSLLARDTLKNFNANRGARAADHVDQMLALLRACW